MKKSIIATMLVFCTLLTGCGDSKATDTPKTADTTKEILQMKHYNKNIDGVIFDTEICINKGVTEDSLLNGTVTLNTVDENKLKSVFIGNKKIVNTENINGKTPVGIQAKFTNLYGENDNWGLSYCDKNTNISFYNGKFTNYFWNCVCLDPLSPNYNANKYSLTDNLSFATREEAFKDIKSTFLSAGLDIGDNYKAYTMDHKTMKKEESVTDDNNKEDKSKYKPSWTEDDDCYYFLVWPQINNIPAFLRYSSTSLTYIQDNNCGTCVIYNKDGINRIDCSELFTLNKDTKKVQLASFDKVAQTITTPYSNLLGDNTYKITKATLAYKVDSTVMSDKYPIVPVWVIEIHEINKNKSQDSIKEIIIDAVTGEVSIDGK